MIEWKVIDMAINCVGKCLRINMATARIKEVVPDKMKEPAFIGSVAIGCNCTSLT
jgi:hypothetical protein